MMELLLLAGFTFMVAFTAYWMGYQSRALEVLTLRRDLHTMCKNADALAAVSVEQQVDAFLTRVCR
jgi:hypothetical protein